MIVSVPVFVTVGVIGYRRRRAAAHAAGSPPALDRKTLLRALGVGMLGYYVASFLDFSALTYISAQFDRLILLTYPFFVVLFGVIFFHRKVTGVMLASLLASYAGILLIFARDFSIAGSNVALGAGLVFASAVAYAGYQILAKPLIDRLGAQLFTSIAMSGAGPAVVLHFLVTHPERVHSRAQLLDRVWGDHVFIEERTVDVHIKRLRESLAVGDCAGLVETVRGAGYRLARDGAASVADR